MTPCDVSSSSIVRESRGRGACGSVGDEGSGPVGPDDCVFWTVAEPLVVVFWVGCEVDCDGPAADEDTPLVWDCDEDAIVATSRR